jgi:hypothetical protein
MRTMWVALIDAGAGGGSARPPAWRQDAHALAFQHAERRLVHALDLILGEDAHRLEGINEVPVAARAFHRGCRTGAWRLAATRSDPGSNLGVRHIR